MGALVSLSSRTVSRVETRGVSVLDEQWYAYRIELGERAPLYQRVAERLSQQTTRVLREGVYECARRWFVVQGDSARFVSEAEALKVLGGCAALLELGLGDAAVSLELGDLTNARYQWLRAKDGL